MSDERDRAEATSAAPRGRDQRDRGGHRIGTWLIVAIVLIIAAAGFVAFPRGAQCRHGRGSAGGTSGGVGAVPSSGYGTPR